jgi:Na+/H+ antiporter NhaC
MKSRLLFLASMLLCSFAAFCAAPDSTATNIIGEIAGGVYSYYLPQIPASVQQLVVILLGVGIPLLAHFAATLKADPTRQPLAGWVGAIFNALSWFQKDVQENASNSEALKKK